MPRINLLPFKEAQQRLSAQHEMIALAVMLVATIAGLFVWHGTVDSDVQAMKHRLNSIKGEIGDLTKDVAKVKELQQTERTVKKKLGIIRSLVKRQAGPAVMLHELAVIFTRESKRVWLTSLQETEGVLELTGGAMDHEDIAEFQLALQRRDLFTNVRLDRVSVDAGKKKGGTRSLKWEIFCDIAAGPTG